ncbi:BgTH12-01623 [Blumeria graminis f. sp. triticale]|uniref:BgTH12-01623 n=1 Tax=Blumeria graminis f. sp. triticale TaxID=1689686 RepID=A0A9W4DKB5_BLUGR|nr:BgTH12-01623 [Blumeria graminis f. sp. triticale]
MDSSKRIEQYNPELDTFRQEWLAEVSSRVKLQSSCSVAPTLTPGEPHSSPNITNLKQHQIITQSSKSSDCAEITDREKISQTRYKDPQVALLLYEQAVEREDQGHLGDSLDLYRRAFRINEDVQCMYQNKHFPLSSETVTHNIISNEPIEPGSKELPFSTGQNVTREMNSGFSEFSVESVLSDPRDTSLPCPITELPDEIIVHIFMNLAVIDVASFARVAQVCKKLAYFVATEEQIWKKVCLSSEVGFGAMHFEWQRDVLGGQLLQTTCRSPSSNSHDEVIQFEKNTISEVLLHKVYRSSWCQMFRLRPRIRFNGCYISTVNYMRPGQSDPAQSSWNTPVHIVTYYRYLRFFRDGSMVSLLTTNEPMSVIHHLTKDLIDARRKDAVAHPSVITKKALRGRWHLSSISEVCGSKSGEIRGDVLIETEGVVPKYIYQMKLSFRNAGKISKNNKLIWRGFWCLNTLTDDSSEFNLKTDKPFYWSRVRSYENEY